MTNYSCTVCKREVLETDQGISCNHCKKWVHHKCNELSDPDFSVCKTTMISGIALNVCL